METWSPVGRGMSTTLQHRLVAFLQAFALWLLTKSVGFWPAFRARLRASCYLWPRRHASSRDGRLPPRYLLLPRRHQRPLAPPSASTPSAKPHPRSSSSLSPHVLRAPQLNREHPSFGHTAAFPEGTVLLPRLKACKPATAIAVTTAPIRPTARRLASHSFRSPPHLNEPRQGMQLLARALAGAHDSTCSRHHQPPAPGTAAAAAAAVEAPWRHYNPFSSARSVRYKIHGCEPSDLQPGWQGRLVCLARLAGTCLAGGYVRPGCVELTLDFLVAATTMTSATAAEAGFRSGGCQPPPQTAALPPPSICGAAQALGASCGLPEAPDVAQILDALGLCGAGAGQAAAPAAPPAAPHGASRAGPVAAAGDAQVQVQIIGMDPVAADAPRVAQLSPRVVALPPATTPYSGGSGHGHVATRAGDGPSSNDECSQGLAEWSSEDDEADDGGRFAAASPVGTVLLRATVCRPVGRDCSGILPAILAAPAVFARGHSEILPARVTRFQSMSAPASTCSPTRGSHARAAGPCSGCSCTPSSGACGCECYELEVLLTLPRRAGVILVELAWDNKPGQVLPLLALPASEAAAVSELQSLAGAASEATAPHAALAQQQKQTQLLNSFLLDAGVWAQTLPPPVPRTQAADADDAAADGPAAMRMRLPVQQRAVLGTNLLRFAVHSGLKETTAWLMRGLAQLEKELAAKPPPAAAAPEAPATPTSVDAVTAHPPTQRCAALASPAAEVFVKLLPPAAERTVPCAACGDGAVRGPAAAAAAASAAAELTAASACGVASSDDDGAGSAGGLRRRRLQWWRRGGGCGDAAQPQLARLDGLSAPKPSSAAGGAAGWAMWLHALLLVLGLRATDEADEAAFRAYSVPWEANQEHIIQAFETAVVLALLFRARADLLTPAHLATLLAGLPGITTLLARLVLRRDPWVRLVSAIKLPRYLFYMAAKAVAVFSNRPLPPGVTSYQLGLGMLLHEGLLLPLACLLPVRTAAVVTVLKVIPCMAMMLLRGVASSRREAGLRCAAVAAIALATTILCHTYLRVCFYRWRHRCDGSRGGGDRRGGGRSSCTAKPSVDEQ
ncbi:hypothetical protein PLESTF_001015400 [Pleodorina starrii]|nr:hypothetical protein PLESTM_001090700 [Pleodorina starrii]GLC70625.1 hypothetical protein PLESTF_001015400 [Pleodorina starrii]